MIIFTPVLFRNKLDKTVENPASVISEEKPNSV